MIKEREISIWDLSFCLTRYLILLSYYRCVTFVTHVIVIACVYQKALRRYNHMKNMAHEIVVESLTESLLKLMKMKPFKNITVSELCLKAGVSRISFYRNFDEIEDILINKLNYMTSYWWNSYTSIDSWTIDSDFCIKLKSIYRKEKDIIDLIYANGLSSVIKSHIFSQCGPKDGDADNIKYASSVIAGAIYGYLDQWFTHHMNDTPFDLSLKLMLNLYQMMIENKKI